MRAYGRAMRPVVTYKCPAKSSRSDGNDHNIRGCGEQVDGRADDEGIGDCPWCGMWFQPDEEENGALP